MTLRQRAALDAAASLLLLLLLVLTSCGGGGGGGGSNPTTPNSATPTASLPLQASGLAVGGDLQSRATDVYRFGITEEQAKLIAKACNGAAEIAPGDQQDCAKVLARIIGSAEVCGHRLCANVYVSSSNVGLLGYDGIVEITDDRPGESLCESGPRHVCARVGVRTSALLDQIVGTTVSTASSSDTTTLTPTSAETTLTSPSLTTSSSAPEVTSAPTTSP